jgi:hypothetical protein
MIAKEFGKHSSIFQCFYTPFLKIFAITFVEILTPKLLPSMVQGSVLISSRSKNLRPRAKLLNHNLHFSIKIPQMVSKHSHHLMHIVRLKQGCGQGMVVFTYNPSY